MICRIASIKVICAIALLILAIGCSPKFDYVILPQEDRPSNTDTYRLSEAEIAQVEALVTDCVPDLSRSLRTYKFQLIPYLNENGQKLVWVNAFCSKENDNWKSEPVIVSDGGDCYFNLTINLSKGKCESLIINGEA